MRVTPLVAIGLAAAALQAAPSIFPLKDVRVGQRGVGRTVFLGSRIEEFQVEILGVLENIGPRESIILARLKGGPLENTGILQGMSGSPVYIDGKLLGAVALGFPLSKEAIAGIRPIEEMLRVDPETKTPRVIASLPARQELRAGNQRLEEIATPVSFSGFSAAILDRFAPQLRALGMDPRQGVSGGGTPDGKMGDRNQLQPGSMISVQLLSGDMSMGADGTVTYVDGDRIYAFGHRFLAGGPTEMPFARSEVLALLPNLSASFKISAAREWMGSITQDRNTAIAGVIGRRAAMVPLEIKVGANAYHMNMIQDRVMTPLVTQMAILSSLDETERSVGPTTFTVRGHIDFDGGSVRVDDVYSGDVSTSTIAAMGVGTPLTYALTSGFDALKLKAVTLDIHEVDRRNQAQISEIAAPRHVRPGEELQVMVTLAGEDGVETLKTVRYKVPVGASSGTLYLTASDAASTNMLDLQSAAGVPVHSPARVLEFLNSLRTNTKAYLRISRAETAYSVEGRDITDAPPSLALILARAQQGAGLFNARGSKIAEIEIPAGDKVVTGSRSTQVEVEVK